MNHALDEIAPAFRAARERWPDAPNLRQHYDDLVRTWEGNGSSLIELIRSFLEAVCWTVIEELDARRPSSMTPSTHQVLRCTLDAVGLSNQRGYGSFDDLISGLNKLTKSIDDLRRNEGSVAHGKDGFIGTISANTLRAYAVAADVVISAILAALEGKQPNLLTTREPVSRHQHHNQRINRTTRVETSIDDDTGELTVAIHNNVFEVPLEIRISPAELLYELYREAYVDLARVLAVSLPEECEDVESFEEKADDIFIEEKLANALGPPPKPTRVKLLDEYQGDYQDRIVGLYEFVIHNLLNGNDSQAAIVVQFVNTLLAEMEQLAVVDWAKRESARSRVRVYLKRLFKVADIEGLGNEQLEPLLEWLAREIESGNGN